MFLLSSADFFSNNDFNKFSPDPRPNSHLNVNTNSLNLKWKEFLETFLRSAGNFTGVVNLVLRSRIGQFLLVADGCSISVLLYKWAIKISYITNGRFYKSDEIAEEKKVFEKNMNI